MNTDERVDDIVETLHDTACEGDVAEVLVIYRDRAGDWHSGMATDDLVGLIDAAQYALSQIEREGRPSGRRLDS